MPDATLRVSDLHRRGQEFANTGNLPAAAAVLRQAEALAYDIGDLSRVDGTLAFVEAELGDTSAARGRCNQALARKGIDEATRALLRGQLGWVEFLTGDAARAIELFGQAIELLEGDDRARVLINRGIARLTVGDLVGAHADFAAGANAPDPLNAAKSTHNLGYVQLLRGEIVSAIQNMDAARPALGILDEWVTAPIDIDRADALQAAGLKQESIRLLRAISARLEATDLWRFKCDVEIRLAGLLPPPDGVAMAESATSRALTHGNPVEADIARSIGFHLRARTADRPEVEDFDLLAERLAEAGRTESARALRIRAAGLSCVYPQPLEESSPLTTHLLAGEVAAEVALAKDDAATALRYAGTAIGELEAWQRNIGSLELQTSTLTLGGEVIGVGQQAALASGEPAALLEWSERAREVSARGVPSRPPEDLGDLLAQLRHLGPDGAPDQRARLIDQIRHGRWHAGGSVTSVHGLTLDSLQASLDDHRFVSLLGISGEVVALVVEADDVRVLRLGPKQEFDTQVGGLGPDLAVAAQSSMSVVRRGLHERLNAMDALLQPALAGAREVVLTMRGEWARVPWGQLESLRGAAVALPVSATAWVRAQEHRANPPRSVAVVVGPDTHTGKQEADAVATAWTDRAATTVLPAATCDQVRDLAGEVDVLHICAHGRDRDGHRLFAATELHDGEWFGHDIELLAGVPDIVVLSACGVGGGSLGMARAWLHAGARYVIASPADISENAAAERFPRLHALLAAGVAPERAVAEAFGPDALDCTVQCYGPPPLT